MSQQRQRQAKNCNECTRTENKNSILSCAARNIIPFNCTCIERKWPIYSVRFLKEKNNGKSDFELLNCWHSTSCLCYASMHTKSCWCDLTSFHASVLHVELWMDWWHALWDYKCILFRCGVHSTTIELHEWRITQLILGIWFRMLFEIFIVFSLLRPKKCSKHKTNYIYVAKHF